jgi:hypothetical protein
MDEGSLYSYSRTNKYHIINGIQMAIPNLNIDINYRNDTYEIEFIHCTNDFICDYYQVYCDSVDTIWKMIKPDTAIVIERSDYGPESALQITYYADIRYRFNTRHDTLSIMYDKLHENETNFRQKLKENKSLDCKIDFF